MSSKQQPIIVEVANFDADHPTYTAEVVIFPNGKARISNRTGWTNDQDLDELACQAAKNLAASQREANRAKRVRTKIHRKKDPRSGKEILDRSSRHAAVKVWPKSDRHNDKLAVILTFDIGAAAEDFILEDVIQEVLPQRTEYGKVNGETQRYVQFRYENGKQVHGDHEWWAARWRACEAIRTARKQETTNVKRAVLREQKQRQRMSEKIRRYGGDQIQLNLQPPASD